MRVIIQGKIEQIPSGITIQELIAAKNLDSNRVVVELNREIVSSERFHETVLHEGDRLELIQFVGGG